MSYKLLLGQVPQGIFARIIGCEKKNIVQRLC